MIQKLDSIIFCIAGVLFLLAAIIQKGLTALLLGCCFLIIGIIKKEK